MKNSITKGLSFGLTSGIITTLGLMVGLHASTQSKIAVASGIIVIAIADALSDALGMHISQESEITNSKREIWESTGSTFVAKFFIALSFLIPVLICPLYIAVIISIIWGLSLITSFSYFLAKKEKNNSKNVILEHLLIALSVIILTHYIGDWASTL